MFNTRLLGCTLAAAAALLLAAGQAQAATTYDITLYGNVAGAYSGSFDSGGDHIDFGGLSLSGLELIDPITVEQGDTINTTVLLDGVFNIPASEIRTSFAIFFASSVFPSGDVKVAGVTSFFLGGVPGLSNGPFGNGTDTSGQIISGIDFFPPDNGDINFDSFTSSFTINELHGPVTLESVQFGYQRLSSAAPEPASWALMLLGFGGLGTMIRTRKRLGAGVAAAART